MTFKITCNWLDKSPKPLADELEVTLAAIRILVGKENVTEFVPLVEGSLNRASEQVSEKLHIPAYFIGEWLAENWWPLLFEPRKTEETGNRIYDARHSLISAQHGFALPDLRIEPFGKAIQISCRGREMPLPEIRFRHSAHETLARKSVRGVLATFVEACASRLTACGVSGTPLQKAWAAVEETSPEEATFCALAGALGIDPYSVSEATAAAIDEVHDLLGPTAALDFCMASAEGDIADNRALVSAVAKKLDGAHQITLAPLRNLRLPQDALARPGWWRGKQTAVWAREHLDIKFSDQLGADKFFEKLRIGTEPALFQNVDRIVFSGAVDRVEEDANIVLVQGQDEARRFAACRAVFLAMDSEPKSRRIVTDTVTRDQQASRAFAAEMLVPSDYLKSLSESGHISRDTIHQVAHERRASVDAVRWQAVNNYLVAEA